MLKDITLGQYFPGNSIAHKLDPRTKILLVTLYIIALFSARRPTWDTFTHAASVTAMTA